MPAPRNCRECGAPLDPDLRWCDLCWAKVVEFAPRPQMQGGGVGPLRNDQVYSRWAKSPTTFGPFGRITCTVVMVLLGPWTANPAFAVIWTPAWVAVSVVVPKVTP